MCRCCSGPSLSHGCNATTTGYWLSEGKQVLLELLASDVDSDSGKARMGQIFTFASWQL
jgi:hypothetical protein